MLRRRSWTVGSTRVGFLRGLRRVGDGGGDVWVWGAAWLDGSMWGFWWDVGGRGGVAHMLVLPLKKLSLHSPLSSE